MSDTFLSLSCAISMHGLFLLCFLSHQLRCPDFSHSYFTSTLNHWEALQGVVSISPWLLALLHVHFRIDRLQGYILEYLLCCTEGLPTRLCNELSVSLVSCANRVRRKSPCVSNILHSVLEYIALRLIMRFLLIFVCIPQVFSSL